MLQKAHTILSFGMKAVFAVAFLFVVINVFLYLAAGKKIISSPKSNLEKTRMQYYANNEEFKKDTSQFGKVKQGVYKLYACAIIGELCADEPTSPTNDYNKSLLGKVGSLIVAPYANPPASGVYWAVNGLQNAGIIPQTYAATGIGFSAIQPLIPIWSAMRNLAYLLLVLVMVIIGFMVMFRMKMNPQTVVSIESALPKIVLSLLYITFSFAIAGFLIDMMYILIILGISVFAQVDPSLSAPAEQSKFLNAGFGTLWMSMFPADSPISRIPFIGGIVTLYRVGTALSGLLPGLVNDGIRGVAAIIMVKMILTESIRDSIKTLTSAFNGVSIATISPGNLPGAVYPFFLLLLLVVVLPFTIITGAGFLLGLIVLFTLLLLLFRIFFLLLTSYIKILLLIILGPIFMLFEALPGRNAFKYWFKTLFAELFTFPLIIWFLLLGRVIINLFGSPNAPTTIGNVGGTLPVFYTDNTMWAPPFIYGIEPQAFAQLLGLGIILMIPDFIKMSREFMGVKGLPFNLQLGTFLGGAGAAIGGTLGLTHQFSSIGMTAHHLTGKQPLELLRGLPGVEGVLKGLGVKVGGGGGGGGAHQVQRAQGVPQGWTGGT